MDDRVAAPGLLEVAQVWWDVERVPSVASSRDGRCFDLVDDLDVDVRLRLLELAAPAEDPREVAEALASGLAACDFPPTGGGASSTHVVATLRAAGLGHVAADDG